MGRMNGNKEEPMRCERRRKEVGKFLSSIQYGNL